MLNMFAVDSLKHFCFSDFPENVDFVKGVPVPLICFVPLHPCVLA